MRVIPLRASAIALACALPLTLAACGGGGGGGKSSSGAPVKGKRGGTLTVLSNGDVDYIDPGAAYYQFSYILDYAIVRPLYSYKPQDDINATPDLAAGPPKISSDKKTITVKIRHGVHFSPPVNREVQAKDVKYGIERGAIKGVANGYLGAYF